MHSRKSPSAITLSDFQGLGKCFILSHTLRKIITLFIAITFIAVQNIPLYAYSYDMAPQFLCEVGIEFYNKGRFADALHEFKKALILNPNNPVAQKYIDLIEQMQQYPPEEIVPSETISSPVPVVVFPETKPQTRVEKPKQAIMAQTLGEMEAKPVLPKKELTPQKIIPPKVIILDQNIKSIRFPIEIEKDRQVILKGQNIQRYLVTEQNILKVEKISPDELLLTGYDFGYTYVHVWDANDRWTLEFLVIPPKFAGLTLAEEMRLAEEKANTFKLRYSLDWSSFEIGRRLDDLKRSSYNWNHWLSLNGETPYGNLYSQAAVGTNAATTDLTYYTLGLENGKFGQFDDFTIRTFDFSPDVTNLAFSSPNLRGAMFSSPAFNKKLDYTVFWGREGGGRYGGLSPGLASLRDSFINGLELNYMPLEKQFYSFSMFHGWGNARAEDLNPYGYDLKIQEGYDNWKYGYEIAFDSERFAHLLTTRYAVANFGLNIELRDTDKYFHTMTGSGWRQGELGVLTNLSYKPTEKLNTNIRLDVYQDRLNPNPEKVDRLNEDFNWDALYTIDNSASFRLDYSLQNQLGRVSPTRYHSAGAGLYKTFDWIKRINTYVNYRWQESKHFNSPGNDFINDKVIVGTRFSLIGDLYYYLNKEFNWLEARYSGTHTQPSALETGLDWNRRLFNSFFYGNFRLTYRDEEDTLSPVSFLSGEDYLEGYGEISYRPNPDLEAFFSSRVRNIWADNPNVNKRMEVNLYAGLRYIWDTRVHWDPIGSIEGYVFKDYNFDGLRQKNEPAIENIKIGLGKKKFEVTDASGHYKFKKVKARKAFVNIDTSTIPAGFVLTTPMSQEVSISQGKSLQINFGMASRTEIIGMVFEDIDGNKELNPNDKGIKGVVLKLEDGTSVTTDESGKYFFRKASVGKHTIQLDLNSLPSTYMPSISIFKEIDLYEGSSYVFNIPLKKVEN